METAGQSGKAETLPIASLVEALAQVTGRSEDLVLVIDGEMAIRFVNHSAARQFEVGAEKSVGKPMGEAFPRLFAVLEPDLRKVLGSNSPCSLEHKIEIGRRECWLDTSLTPIPDGGGEALAVLCISREVTARRQVGELIVRAKREWLQAIDAIPYLVAVCDSHHRISRVNMAMAQKLGVSAGQAIGLVCYERLHEMGKIPRFCPVEPKGEWDGELSVEMWENHFGGRYLVSVSPLCGSEANRVSGCVYVARDVSRAEPVPKTEPSQREVLKSLIHDCDYVILIQDLDGRFVLLNTLPANSFSSNDLCGKTPYECFDPQLAATMIERVRQVGRTGEEMSFIGKHFSDRDQVHFLNQLSPIRDAAGRINGVMTVSRRIPAERESVGAPGQADLAARALTKREREILCLIANGLSNLQIADQLCISKRTVETHKTRIMRKLDIRRTSALVSYAVKTGVFGGFPAAWSYGQSKHSTTRMARDEAG